MTCSNLWGLVDECKEGIEDDFRDSGMEDWLDDGAIYQYHRNEEVGVAGPGSSRDELSLGHIAFHMAGKMSST